MKYVPRVIGVKHSALNIHSIARHISQLEGSQTVGLELFPGNEPLEKIVEKR